LLNGTPRNFCGWQFGKIHNGKIPEVLNPDGKTLQFRYLSALAAKFIDNIRINIDNIRINVDDFPAKLVPLD